MTIILTSLPYLRVCFQSIGQFFIIHYIVTDFQWFLLFFRTLNRCIPSHVLEMNCVFVHPVPRMPRYKLCIRTSCLKNIIEISRVLVHYVWRIQWSEEAFSLFSFGYCASCWISDIFTVMWISLMLTEKWKKRHGIWHGCIDKCIHYAWEFVVSGSLWP